MNRLRELRKEKKLILKQVAKELHGIVRQVCQNEQK